MSQSYSQSQSQSQSYSDSDHERNIGSSFDESGDLSLGDEEFEEYKALALQTSLPYEAYGAERKDRLKVEKLLFEELWSTLEESDVRALRRYIAENYTKLIAYDYLRTTMIDDVINVNLPPDQQIPIETNVASIVTHVQRIIHYLKEKIQTVDSSWQMYDAKPGSSTDDQTESLKRIDEKIMDYQSEIIQLEDQLKYKEIEIIELEAELEAAKREIQFLKGQGSFDMPEDEDIFQRELMRQQELNSSLMDEVERKHMRMMKLKEDIMNLERDGILAKQVLTVAIADAAESSRAEFKMMITDKIKALTPNKEEIKEAVDAWLSAVDRILDMRADQLHELKTDSNELESEIGRLEHYIGDQRKIHRRVKAETEALAQEMEAKEEEMASLEMAITELEDRIRDLNNRYLELEHEAEIKREQLEEMQNVTRSSNGTGSSFGSPGRYGGTSDHSGRSMNSFEFPRGQSSPDSYQRSPSPHRFDTLDSSGPLSDSTYSNSSPSMSSGSPTSPIRTSSPGIRRIEPGTQTLPEPQSRIAPRFYGPGTQTLSQPQSRVGPIDPATQNISGITNRFDVGRGFNMQTVHSGAPSAYSQVTRVDSAIPEAGPSRMLDSPVNIAHTTEFDPLSYATPIISTYSRHGYTDAKECRVLNVPPDIFDERKTMKRTVMLTSPARKDPLVVDIDVDPKPLQRTESGEHFICDISLNVQDSGPKRWTSIATYGVPPAQTPTITRKKGKFTPKGIFKKRHLNIREIFGPDYESPQYPFPPKHLPFDSRSPISSISSSPPTPEYSDSTISWEKSPMLNTTFDASRPPLNKTFSPVMNQTFSPVMNRTFDASPSPVIPGGYIDTSTSSGGSIPLPMDSTFDSSFDRSAIADRSMPPMMDGTFDRSRSPVMDRTFDRSRSPVMDRTFDRSVSPGARLSPGLDSTYSRSPSPVIQGRYVDPSTSPSSSMSPVIRGRYPSSPSTGTTMSPVIRGRYASSPSTGTTMSPVIRGRYSDSSPSTCTTMPPMSESSPSTCTTMPPMSESSPSTCTTMPPMSESSASPYGRSASHNGSASPVIKDRGRKFRRNVPPSIIRTASRREGPYTPKSIFKRMQYNMRQLFGPDYESPRYPFSPKHLPFDSRSPISSIPTSPEFEGYDDRTMSWEKVPMLDTTMSPVIKGRYIDSGPSTGNTMPPGRYSGSSSPSTCTTMPPMTESSASSRGRRASSYGSTSPIIKDRGRMFRRNVPPSITHTTSRREGPFTPKSIFKKKQYNVRQLYGPDYESPRYPFSPKHLPFDSRSPVSSIPTSPEFEGYDDRTMSWEKVPMLDTSGSSRKSPSPIIKGRYVDTSTSSGSSTSPVIKGRYIDTSSESSASPMNLRFDRTIDQSMSPQSDRSQSPGLDDSYSSHDYDRSASKQINTTFDRWSCPSPMDNTFSTVSSQSSIDNFSMSGIPERAGTRSPGSPQNGNYNTLPSDQSNKMN